MGTVTVISAAIEPRLRLSLVASEDISFDRTCGSPACIGQVKGDFYPTAPQMRWALEAGYGTSFMKRQFARLLQLPTHA